MHLPSPDKGNRARQVLAWSIFFGLALPASPSPWVLLPDRAVPPLPPRPSLDSTQLLLLLLLVLGDLASGKRPSQASQVPSPPAEAAGASAARGGPLAAVDASALVGGPVGRFAVLKRQSHGHRASQRRHRARAGQRICLECSRWPPRRRRLEAHESVRVLLQLPRVVRRGQRGYRTARDRSPGRCFLASASCCSCCRLRPSRPPGGLLPLHIQCDSRRLLCLNSSSSSRVSCPAFLP